MFEQHPVPQQISSYQFRLVGDMTIKQFFEVAGGAVVGLLIYALPLPGFLKWPFIVISVILGAAFAFLPIQERPFEEWLMAFFRSIYSPTLFYWTKTTEKKNYFSTPQTAVATAPPVNQVGVAQIPVEDQPKQAYLKNLDETEKSFLSSITNIFKFPTGKSQAPIPEATEPASDKVVKQVMQTPPQKPAQVVQQGYQKPTQQPAGNVQTTPVAQTLAEQQNQQAAQAVYSQAAAPPVPPNQPNIIVGQVLDNSGKIVSGAVLEVTDMSGRPVRALKTNNVGHFLIVTPLANGQYRIVIEKEGLLFEPISFEAKGEIIPPIAIKSK